MPLVDFSDDDLRALRDAVNRLLGQREGAENRDVPEDSIHAAPEVYIARVVGSIPALTQNAVTGTGTGSAAIDTPGSLSCNIYRINSSGKTEPIGIARTIYNLSRRAFTGEWVPVVRDKSGKWLAFWCCDCT
jgi:hypothetical protein